MGKDEAQVSARTAGKTIQEKYADVTLHLIEEHGDNVGPLTEEKEKRLRRKLYWKIMFLVSVINLTLFVS
ncbi:uncharacterized protein LDX57_008638 [Aspergillus melleus]|uniref:uncharacterized protein n=1 Tax=Aspergillus melleus TaxID=138277 RepID=UPI001E8D87B2|nr:uncharacterized protein LDX57_008638 [Aspergillus melleus]KAH8430976.1 hypothetical protein LDX57_008638 [Aspergillus melleus]